MTNTYTLSIIGSPMGDAATGVIEQVEWRLTGTNGTDSTSMSGLVTLPPIDPTSPSFIPLAQVTISDLLQWANMLLPISDYKSQIDSVLAPRAQLALASAVAQQAAAGVPV